MTSVCWNCGGRQNRVWIIPICAACYAIADVRDRWRKSLLASIRPTR